MEIIFLLIYLAIVVAIVAGVWKAFAKAGEPGWACIVPIYNIIVMLRLADKPWWWLFLLMIPLVSIIFAIIVSHQISKNFGGGIGMTLMLIFLPFVAWPMLGFGSATYSKG